MINILVPFKIISTQFSISLNYLSKFIMEKEKLLNNIVKTTLNRNLFFCTNTFNIWWTFLLINKQFIGAVIQNMN